MRKQPEIRIRRSRKASPRQRGTGGLLGNLYLEGYKRGLRHGWEDAISYVKGSPRKRSR